MSDTVEQQQARTFGEAALKAMLANGVPPTPQNYALWFAYASGTAPELKRAVDGLIAAKLSFTPAVLNELHTRYVDAARHYNVLSETGGRLHLIVEQVRKHVSSAAGEASNFGRTLDDFSTAIGGQAGAGVQELLADLVTETQRVAEQNRALEQQLNRASDEVYELRQNLRVVQREALTDSLTGIPNRKYLDMRLKEAARDAAENDEPLSLLLADIDHFKRFNDTFGHQIGDQVLRLVARTLTDSVKGRDTPARYGGEEFAIVLPQTGLAAAAIVAEQIRKTMMRRMLVGKDSRDNYGTVTLSFGAAQYRPGEALSELISRADAALYHAKANGRNGVATEAMVPPVAQAS